MRELPNNFALIIGAMKSATTSLFRYLAEHPEIAPCHPKEPHFFAYEDKWAKGVDWYRSLWKWRPGRHKIALEATAAYTKRPYIPDVPERIARIKDAQFRFVYIMRHPLERIESHSMYVTKADGVPPLDQGIPQIAIWTSQYAMQLDAYRRFGPDRILLLFTEELAADPRRVVREVCRFLEVDPNYEFQSLDVQHYTRQRHHAELPKVLKRLRRLGLVKKMLRKLPEVTRDNLRSRFVRHAEFDESRFRLTPRQRELVLETLRPDLQRLQEQYGVDVESRWGIGIRAR